jgi:phosphoglycolate phosphatase
MKLGLEVATSKLIKVALEVVKYSGIRNLSIHIQGTEDFPQKPNPEVILRVISLSQCTPSLMVGDRTEDIHAAKMPKFLVWVLLPKHTLKVS